MKTIGLLGGMSWESTQTYYQALNQGIQAELGGFHSARIAMFSVDFAEIEALQHQGLWQETGDILTRAAQGVEAAGADFLMIGTNTMHKVAEQVEAGIGIPLLHIADATAARLKQNGVSKVGLLGTRFTMEQMFYRGRLEQQGIEVLVPFAEQQTLVHDIIYQELCQGQVLSESRARYLDVMEALVEQGAQGVILGCTEIGMLVKAEHTDIPLYDTTAIHAEAAVKLALS